MSKLSCIETPFDFGTAKVLITGGLGFIGSHFVRTFVERFPKSQITIMDCYSHAVVDQSVQDIERLKDVKIIAGDTRSASIVDQLVEKADVVFHFAAETHVPNSFADENLFWDVNVCGTNNMLNAAKRYKVERFVHISTDEVYGTTLHPVFEDCPFAPTTPYAVSKVRAEELVSAAAKSGLNTLILRPTNAIGTGQNIEKLAPRFVDLAFDGKKLTIEGDGLQERSFIPVGDLAEGILLASTSGVENGIYNIAGKESYTVLEFAELIRKAMGTQLELEFLPDRKINDRSYRVDGSRLAELGFVQKSSVRGELSKIIQERYAQSHLKLMNVPSIAPHSIDVQTELNEKIAFHLPHKAKMQDKFLMQAITENRFRSGGKLSQLAQDKLRTYFGKTTYITNSCTAAMEIAGLALNLQPGDEVIVPSYTFAATVTAFARTGAKVVLHDIDRKTMMLDLDRLEDSISLKTKAIVAVHYGGSCIDMDHLMGIANAHGIAVVEDAAQAFGTRWKGQLAGTFGMFGAISFHESKILHCGHGGALLVNTDKPKIVERVDIALQRGTNFTQFATGAVKHYECVGLGSSYQPTELQAAMLYAQLMDVEEILHSRKCVVEKYKGLFSRSGIEYLAIDNSIEPNGHAFVLIMESAKDADNLIAYANGHGVELQSHYKPIHLSKYAKRFGVDRDGCPVAGEYWQRLVRLPVYETLMVDDVKKIAGIVKKFVSNRGSIPDRVLKTTEISK